MARGRDTIKQRIALDGGQEFKAELEALGKSGERVWRQLQKEAAQFKGPDTSVTARLRDIAKECGKVGEAFRDMGQKVRGVGQTMSVALTLPIAAGIRGLFKVAGDFEEAMIDLKVAAGATGEEFTLLRDKAREIGKSTAFGPREAAAAMTELAKTGTTTTAILGGAADATVRLATANGAELAPAAKLVSDALKQFKIDVGDVDKVVQLVSGAVNQSKLDFADFQLGMAQTGAVAAEFGLSFEDLNVALAGTSSNFASGADAGTSFKTFLQALKPDTKETIALAREMGLQFYDTRGKMLPLADIAELLQKRFAGLSDEDRSDKMSKFFGTDGIRTALGLMNLGRDGVEKLRASILGFDVDSAAAARMKGFNGGMRELRGALEELKIVIGDSGILQWAKDFVKWLTELVDKLAKTNPVLLKWGTIIAGIVAVIGPLLAAIGLMVSGFGFLASGVGIVIGAFAPLVGVLTGIVAAIAGVIAAGVSFPVLLAAAFAAGFAAVYLYWDQIKAGAQGAWDYIVGLFDGSALAAAWSALGSGLDAVWQGIVSAASAAWQGIVAGAQAAWDGVAAGASALGQGIVSAFSALGLGSVWSTIASGAQAAWDAIAAGARAAWDLVTAGAGLLGEAVGAALSGLPLAAGLVWDALSLGASAAFSLISQAASAAWETIKAGAKGALDVLSGNWTGLGDMASNAWASIQGSAESLWAGIVSTFEANIATVTAEFDAMVAGIEAGWQALLASAQGIAQALTIPFATAAANIQTIFAGIVLTVQAAMQQAVAAVEAAASQMIATLKRVEAQIRATMAAAASAAASGGGGDEGQGFATGGHVRGPGSGTSDSIAAWLSNGEFVLKAAAVRKYGVRFLQMLNGMQLPKGKLPGYASGGLVSRPSLKLGLPAFAGGGLAEAFGAVMRGFPPMGRLPALPALAGPSAGAGLQPINLTIGTEQIGQVLAPEPVAANLMRFASRQKLRSAGRKPSWY